MDASASSTAGEDPVEKFKKLPLTERVVHKQWKVREAACRELTDKFSAASEDSKIYSEFFSTLGKIVRDSNAPAQLVGFEALSKFADTAPLNLVRKATADVVKGIAEKGLAGRLQNKMKAIETFLAFVGADAGDVAVAAMATAGFSHRTPKIAAAAVDAVNQALSAFGKRNVPLKVVAEKLPPLFGHSQEIVRNAAKGLAIEMHRWVGGDVRVVMKGAKEVTVKELEAAFAKHRSEGKPEATRLTRSMRKRVREGDEDLDDGDEDDGFGIGEPENEEPEAEVEINLIEKLLKVKIEIEEGVTKDWYTAVDSKKWKARKSALDEAVAIVGQAKLTPVNHQEILTRLRKIFAKDTNVNVVASAASLLSAMCNGLRKNFPASPAKALTLDLFGRLKEKNRIMVDSVTKALDTLHLKKCLRVIDLQEEIATAAMHKTPKARCELLLWLGRCLRQGTAGVDLKGAPLKFFGGLFVKGTDDSSPDVRDAALSGLASLQKLVGEKNMSVHLEKLDKKRKDKVAGIARELPDIRKIASHDPKKRSATKSEVPPSKMQTRSTAKVIEDKSVPPRRVSKSPKKRPPSARRTKQSEQPKITRYESDDEGETSLSPENALDMAVDRFKDFEKANWSGKSFKARVACMTMVNDSLSVKETFTDDDISFALGLLTCSPGLADTNFMALKPKLELFGMIAKRSTTPLPRKTLRPLLLHTTEKLGDIKSSKTVGEILMSYAEVTSPRYLFEILAEVAMETNNNRAVIAILKFGRRLVEDFGVPAVPERTIVSVVAGTIGNAAPAARSAAVTLACRASIRVESGAFRRKLIDHNVSEEYLEVFDAELQKYGQEPDPPTRKKKFGNEDVGVRNDRESEVAPGSSLLLNEEGLADDLSRTSEMSDSQVPPSEPTRHEERVSLADEFAPGSRIFLDLKNSNWKKRQDALAAVATIIKSGNGFIKPDVGIEMINAIRARLSDSNRNLAVAAYNLLNNLTQAMGTAGITHLKAFAPTVFGQGCVDIKRSIRDAATKVVRSWYELFGLGSVLPYCHLPLASLNSSFRKEFLEWLIPCLQGEVGSFDASKEDLSPLVDTCFACLRDRTTEVRHLADLMFEQVVRSVGIGAIDMKLLSMTKAARNQIEPVLDKYRASAPKAGTPGLPPLRSGIPVTPRSARERPRSMALPRTPASRRGAAPGEDFSTPSGGSSRRQRPSSARVSPLVPSPRDFERHTTDDVPILMHNEGRDARAQRFLKKRHRFIQELNEADPSGDVQPIISEDVDDLMEDLNECCSPFLCTKLTAPANRFRMHVEAIEIVTSYLDTHPESLVYAADVLLRWSACRIEDSRTPPTVLVKLAVFVSNICEVLMSSGTKVGEYEACAVLPPIVDKCGSMRESIREAMRSSLLSIGDVVNDDVLIVLLTSCLRYPVSPRAHDEVANEICRLIEKRCSTGAGMPAGVLPTIGKIAGSEDDGAGRAAAVCLDCAHEYFGDDLWELVGGLTDSEAQLLESRLKAVPSSSKEETHSQKEPEVSETVREVPDSSQFQDQRSTKQRPISAVPSDIRSEDFRLSVAPAPPNSVVASISNSLNTATPRRTHNHRTDSVPETPGLPMKHGRVMDESENESLVADILDRLQSHDRDMQLSGLASIFDDLRRDGVLLTYAGSSVLLLQLLKCFTEVLGRLQNGTAEEDDPAVLKSFLKGVIRFAREPELLRKLDQSAVERLLADALNAMLPQTIDGVEDWDQVRRGVNLMIVKVLESCNQNLLYTAMINLLLENIKAIQHSGSGRLSSPLAKSSICIKSIAKVTKRGFGDCRINALLRDIHLFLVANPVRRDGKPSADDQTFAMRLLKTVVNAIIDDIGADIRRHLNLIPYSENSQLVHYIDMTLGGPGEADESREESNRIESPSDQKESEACISRCLSNIDKGIRSDSVLRQLQNELERHPDIALDAYLAKYNHGIQVFVKNGLDRLGRNESAIGVIDRPDIMSTSDSAQSGYVDASSAVRDSIPVSLEGEEITSTAGETAQSAGHIYLKRLQEIQLRYGLQTGNRSQTEGIAVMEKENGPADRAPSAEDMRDKASILRERMARLREFRSSSKD